MESGLKKKYGLITAIAMVIGIVIGSGVFFKAERVLNATGGDLPLGILAWLIGGMIMVICAYVFATMATKYQYVSGVVDYAEVAVGKKYAYYMGWFLTTMYYPAIASVLAWASARYTCVLLGWPIAGGECMVIACFYMVAVYTMNMLSPVLTGYFQVSTTVIKLIPLLLMAVVGTIVGLSNGTTIANFTTVVQEGTVESPLFTAVVATAFAYEGWIVATSINSELKNAKKNLPIALTAGTILIVTVYILYYVGLAGAAPNQVMMENGEQGALIAFGNIFESLGSILFVFVIISCLGTLNGLLMGCVRGMYALAVRGTGPNPKVFSHVDPATNMPPNSGVIGLLLTAFWLLFFYGANLGAESWFGPFAFDSSELPIVALYAMYIPIFIKFAMKQKDLPFFKRFFMPSLAVGCCLLMIVAAYYAHHTAILWFLILFAVFMAVGTLFSSKAPSNENV